MQSTHFRGSRVHSATDFLRSLVGGKEAGNVEYYLILGATVGLTIIGLLMVFSASSVELASFDKANAFSVGIRESVYAAVGLVGIFIVSHLSRPALQLLAWVLIFMALPSLLLVLVAGKTVGGNQNWLEFGIISFQPSELAKLALILWAATVLSSKEKLLGITKHLLLPVIPVSAVIISLILFGRDLGTAMIVMTIIASILYFVGAPRRFFVSGIFIGLVLAIFMALGNSNRAGRVSAWLGQCSDGNKAQGLCDQVQNSILALASGGLFGTGLGQGRQKWKWIPEAHNDFIFSIIGEEFGLLGTSVVLFLYMVLMWSIYRVLVRQTDIFVRIICGSVMIWVGGQAFVNIAMVSGLLPVIGVPLPLVSYGGSALLSTLVAIGAVLNCARMPKGSIQPASSLSYTALRGHLLHE